ncbi:MAG: 30S ribosomal protein S12 methylthiotransferase RimO [Tissierellia bacterium]|nr:30S ribosomal protein S12 methylthiotransferase RimO [Tissierellia bacterium]
MTDKKVYFTTLGCSKNDVDTDSMRTILEGKNYASVYDPESADVIVINTCGFIESAKEESIEEIFNMVSIKGKRKILVSGCLSQRYGEELLEEIPEIDGILGTGQIENIEEFIHRMEMGERVSEVGNLNAKYTEGIYKSNVSASEYVKIGEGCNNFCSYCIIPKLRGKNRSRSIEEIYDEVSYLVENGTREIILIAQNTTDYGIDNYKEYALSKLLNKLEEIEELKWIRVLYLYPDNFTEELIHEFSNNKKLLPYVDIPLQHINDDVLKNMNRRTNKKDIVDLIQKLRGEIPEIVIRSTFIVGFPGETAEQFEELLEFLKEVKLDRVGAFGYSKEEGTKAYEMDGHLTDDIKKERVNKLMELQEEISLENLEKRIGSVVEVLIEEELEDTLIGRSYMDAPEIDGVVYINKNDHMDIGVGDFIDVRVIDVMEHDLIGEINELSK